MLIFVKCSKCGTVYSSSMSVFKTTIIALMRSDLLQMVGGKYDYVSPFLSIATSFSFYENLPSILTEFDLDSSVHRKLEMESISPSFKNSH